MSFLGIIDSISPITIPFLRYFGFAESIKYKKIYAYDPTDELKPVVATSDNGLSMLINRLEFSVFEFEQGLFFVTPFTHQGHKVPMKFVKIQPFVSKLFGLKSVS